MSNDTPFTICYWTIEDLKSLAQRLAPFNTPIQLEDCGFVPDALLALLDIWQDALADGASRMGRSSLAGSGWYGLRTRLEEHGVAACALDRVQNGTREDGPRAGLDLSYAACVVVPLAPQELALRLERDITEAHVAMLKAVAPSLSVLRLHLIAPAASPACREKLTQALRQFKGSLNATLLNCRGEGREHNGVVFDDPGVYVAVAEASPEIFSLYASRLDTEDRRDILSRLDYGRIRELHLGQCDLKDDDVVWLMERLKKAPLLHYLDLTDNSLGVDALQAVCAPWWGRRLRVGWFTTSWPNLPGFTDDLPPVLLDVAPLVEDLPLFVMSAALGLAPVSDLTPLREGLKAAKQTRPPEEFERLRAIYRVCGDPRPPADLGVQA